MGLNILALRPGISGAWLPKIQSLLFDVYIKEQNWTFEEENPSNLRIDQRTEDKPFLIDRFMKTATWIIAVKESLASNQSLSDKDLVGVIRLIENEPIELASYTSKPRWGGGGGDGDDNAVHGLLEKYKADGLIEVNRFAVQSDYRDKGVGRMLMQAFVQYTAEKKDDNRPVVASIPLNCSYRSQASVLVKLARPFGEPFYYEKTDPAPAQLYVFQKDDLRRANRYILETGAVISEESAKKQ